MVTPGNWSTNTLMTVTWISSLTNPYIKGQYVLKFPLTQTAILNNKQLFIDTVAGHGLYPF